MPTKTPPNTVQANKAVLAAGGVLWRHNSDLAAPEVAIIHRPRYDDWSLPKGKVDPGETEPVTAVREVHEETGLRCTLGRELSSTSYTDRKGRAKVVRYWLMDVTADDGFTPDDEVDELRWVPPADAAGLLSYPHDAELIEEVA